MQFCIVEENYSEEKTHLEKEKSICHDKKTSIGKRKWFGKGILFGRQRQGLLGKTMFHHEEKALLEKDDPSRKTINEKTWEEPVKESPIRKGGSLEKTERRVLLQKIRKAIPFGQNRTPESSFLHQRSSHHRSFRITHDAYA